MSAVARILTIAWREVRGGLYTPLLWVILIAGQLVLAWVLLQVVEDLGGPGTFERRVGPLLELMLHLFGFAAVVVLFAAPLVAMRMISGERREGVFDLLVGAPVRLGEVLLGKYLGLIALMTPLCLLPALNLLLLGDSLDLDAGHLAAATLGLWLAALLFGAIGLYGSSLTDQPAAAALLSFGILLLFSIIGRAEQWLPPPLTLFGWLTWNEHLLWFIHGAVRFSDLVYFAGFSLFFLALSHRRLANRRLA